MDRHYLLYATSGTMRLMADGQSWLLPPTRAALIAADRPIEVTILSRLTASSILFLPGFVPPPHSTLSVFEVSALARELIAECRQWGADSAPLSDYAVHLFTALAQVAWRLARTPSPAVMPVAKSSLVERALRRTEEQMASDPSLVTIAAEVATTPRSLARRFQAELGMTWSQALRRMRVIRAMELLATTDEPIARIAYSVGYQSLSAFGAAFRDVCGEPPSRFRLPDPATESEAS